MAFLLRLDRRDRRRSVSHFCKHGNDLVVIEFGHRVPIRTVSLSKTGFGKFSGFLRQLLLLVLSGCEREFDQSGFLICKRAQLPAQE